MEYADFNSLRNSNISDEIVHVKCPDTPDGTGKVIEVKRSSLLRSPALAKLILSTYYLEGCDMIITFLHDPAVCFEIVKNYLNEGPDRYTRTRLRVYLLVRYKVIDRFLIHGRLYLLAKKLSLPGLMEIAYECLEEAERLMTPSHCVTMTSLIFGIKFGFDKRMKDWCMKHVGIHFAVLHMTTEWNELVPNLDPDFRKKWAKLVLANVAILTAIEEEADDKALEEMIHQMEQAHQGSVVSAIEGSTNEMSFEEVISQVLSETKDEPFDEDWEDMELQTIEDKAAGAKAKSKPGAVKASRRARPWTKSRIPVPNTRSAKARELMGINQDSERKCTMSTTNYSKRIARFLQ